MRLSEREAQELHELVGGALEVVRDGGTPSVADLVRARELAALVVADSQSE